MLLLILRDVSIIPIHDHTPVNTKENRAEQQQVRDTTRHDVKGLQLHL